MAVLCPIYDPIYGWYILLDNGKKEYISSLLYYYYSMGVSPPIGAKITEDDIEDFQADLSADNEEDPDYDFGYVPISPESFIPKLAVLPPPLQYQSIPDTGFDSNQIASTSSIGPSTAPMAVPNYLPGPSLSSVDNQPLSHVYPNQSALMTDPYNSYLLSLMSAMLPYLTVPMSKIAENEEMESMDYEDEFEEESSIMYDCSSIKSTSSS